MDVVRIHEKAQFWALKYRGLPGGSVVKNLPAMQETQVQSLGWEDPLEKGVATLENSMEKESGRLQSLGLQRVENTL